MAEAFVRKIQRSKDMQQQSWEWIQSGESIGFVPTMGYLHDGHLSLVREARANNDRVVVSIFVNPTQFCPGEDFEQYPRDENRDLEYLKHENIDAVFIPNHNEIYPQKFSTFIEPPTSSLDWCGKSRPGHFRGVCTILSIFFNIVLPSRCYLGQKDAQQSVVIRQLVNDLFYPLEIVVCPTVREDDGLAMSSRNNYLSNEQRKSALILYHTLKQGSNMFHAGENSAESILQTGKQNITQQSDVIIDYLGIVEPNNFKSVELVKPGCFFIGAIYLGKTRLIDNIIF